MSTEEKCCEVAGKIGSKVRALYDNAGGEIRDVRSAVEDKINAEPVQSTLIALGAGLILGLLLGRK